MKFFADGGKKVQADAASRKSVTSSKISAQFKDRFARKIEEEVPVAEPQMEKVEEIIYESDLESGVGEQTAAETPAEDEDLLSQAPTETLKREY